MLAGGQRLRVKRELNYLIDRKNGDNLGPILRLGFGGTGEIS